MRDILRVLGILVGTPIRTAPWRSLGVLLEPVAGLTLPMMAVGLKYLTDGVLQGNTGYVVAGVVLIGGIPSLLGVIGFVGTDMRIGLRERMGFEFDREVAKLAATVPGLDHHERADYKDKLELIRHGHYALATSLGSILAVVTSLVTTIGVLAVLIVLNPVLLLLVLFALPAIPVAFIQQRWQRVGEEQSATPSRLARHLRGLTTDRNAGMELRVFGLQDEIRARFRTAALAALRPFLRAYRKSAIVDSARELILALGYIGAVGFMLWRAAEGQASAGDVVAAAFICRQVAEMIIAPIFSVAGLGPTLRAAGRLLWLRDYAASAESRRPGTGSPSPRLAGGIVFDNVSFTYPGTDREVLRDISLTIPAGAVVALVGENGAGKTTIVKLLTRMYEPTSGRILVDGVDLATIDVTAWRSRLAAAFQDFVKFEVVAQHTVGAGDLPRLDDAEAALGALRRAGATEVVEALPSGLSTQLGSTWQDGVDLSTGQWQKLALGRALLREGPLLVFFDEPTASLDALTEHALFARFADNARARAETGSITMLVSHRFSTVRAADQIVVLDGCRVAEAGSHDQLMANGALYAELYSLQARSYA